MVIGISAPPGVWFREIQDFLLSAGWRPQEVVHIYHENDAARVRAQDGVVVHVETGERPHFEGHITSGHLECRTGDYVLHNARNPAEYLPRLLGMLIGMSGAA